MRLGLGLGSGLGSEGWGFEGLEGARLAHEHWLLAGAPLDGAGHRAVARPLLLEVRERRGLGGASRGKEGRAGG